MSIMGILKAVSSLAAIAEPHITKIIDYKRALAIMESENERLESDNKSLKTQLLVTTIVAVVFFVAFTVCLIMLLSK